MRLEGVDPTALRLVATDLDGTLLHTDGTVTERTRAVIDELDARGVVVVFVTGRPVRWMHSLWQHVGAHGLAICSNGAVVYDVARHEIVRVRPVPRDVGLAVADEIRAALPGTTFSVERTDGFGREPSFPARPQEREVEGLRVAELDEVFNGQVVKLLALHGEHDPADYWASVEAVVDGRLTTTWSSVGALVEISGPGVTKASTLELLCDEQGIAAEQVVAFGDMPNDIALLGWAGTSYAMGNAHPSVREHAGHVAPRNDEDGVAQVLERLFLA